MGEKDWASAELQELVERMLLGHAQFGKAHKDWRADAEVALRRYRVAMSKPDSGER